MLDLRRHNLERTFAHQFRLMATRQPPPTTEALHAGRSSGARGIRWRPTIVRRRRKPGPVAARHAGRAECRRSLTEEWLMRRHLARDRRQIAPDENQIIPTHPGRRGPMSCHELYQWHMANGTLYVFFQMFGK